MHHPIFSSPRRATGFTLIELMIVVAVLGILAAIAMPIYSSFVQRSKIIGATARLSDVRAQMEKYFMDNRTYLAGAACGVQDPTINAYNSDASRDFTITCPAVAQGTYTLQADGIAARGMSGFRYTIQQDNTKTTAALPSGWSGAGNLCWVTRKDGSCG
jgi:type IV pilus assembly protein PilE